MTTTAYWYCVRESNPSLRLEGPRTYPEVQHSINLVLRDGLEPPSPDYKTGILAFVLTEHKMVPPTRIELVMTGYQPIVIPFNYRGIVLNLLQMCHHRYWHHSPGLTKLEQDSVRYLGYRTR